MKNNCPICHSAARKNNIILNDYRLCIDNPTTYRICSNCKTVFQEQPIVEDDLRKHYSEGYSYHRQQKKKNSVQHVFSPLLRFLLKPLERYEPPESSKKLSILDVGCGKGDFLLHLRRRGFLGVEGIELSSTAAAIAKSENLQVHNTSLEMFVSTKRYNIITLHQVFEHLRDPHAAIKKLSALLEEDGMLIMSMPNNCSLATALFGRFWPGYDAPRHYFTYNPRSIYILCRKNNLNVVKIKHISRPSQFTGSMQYICNRLTGRKTVLEYGFFRNSVALDLLFFPLAYLLNIFKCGDMIEVYIKK